MTGPTLRRAAAWTIAAALTIGGCVSFPPAPTITSAPYFLPDALISGDATVLPAMVWPANDARAVVVALHGMNDYANAFGLPAGEWSGRGITTYAIDQRGFGRAPARGRWPGAATMKADLRAGVAAARRAHPGLPVYVVGHSMGGAVALAAMADDEGLDADGVVLAAPAVWGGARMPILYRATINLVATLAPGHTATGERAGRRPTDNIEIWRQMAADPLMVGPTRLDATLGIVRLMGEAWRASAVASGDFLVLVGARDEIIPPDDIAAAASRLDGDVVLKTYPEGWHLLFRDLARAAPTADAADWILTHAAADRGAARRAAATAEGA